MKAARAALSNIPPRISKVVGETTDKVKSAAAKQVENTVAAAKDIGGKAKATAKKAASNVKQKLKSTTKESCRNAKGNANRLDDVADTPNSFVAGTLVVMADGSTKPIEKVKPGDTVKATDAEAGVTEEHQVTATVTGKGGKELVELTLVGAGSGSGGRPAEIMATAGHKFYSPAKGWTEAGDLKVGDTLRDAKGRKVTVARTVDFSQATTVYNLTIDGIHTYYVRSGDASVLVHNCSFIGPQDHVALGRDPRGSSLNVRAFADQVQARHLMAAANWRGEVQNAVSRVARGESRSCWTICREAIRGRRKRSSVRAKPRRRMMVRCWRPNGSCSRWMPVA